VCHLDRRIAAQDVDPAELGDGTLSHNWLSRQ
jgi:hypothetical protein